MKNITHQWSIETLKARGKNMREVRRICSLSLSGAQLAEEISRHDADGIPLIIENHNKHPDWPKEIFDPEAFNSVISVRNVHDRADTEMYLTDFLAHARQLPPTSLENETKRFYGKDLECPEHWRTWLKESKVVVPALLPGSPNNLLDEDEVETLMCYMGVGDTYTPAHKDLCSSSGQNLLVYAEDGGSAFWFMTESRDALLVAKFFRQLNRELDEENYLLTPEELARAPFDIYVAHQKLGDLVLVPQRSCHQVINFGGISVKASWSRMTLDGLAMALYYELPIYHRVCRPETYRIKSTIFRALITCAEEVEQKRVPSENSKLESKILKLLELCDHILKDEYLPCNYLVHVKRWERPNTSELHHLVCDFCGADIFQGFFQCNNGETRRNASNGELYAVCTGCYVEGRSCRCGDMIPCCLHPYQEFIQTRQRAVTALKYLNEVAAISTEPLLEGGIFHAACILRNMRNISQSNEDKNCRESYPHLSPAWSTLYCRLCHGRRCFKHILTTSKLHAADAIHLHSRDETHQCYHSGHLNSRARSSEKTKVLANQEAEGSMPDILFQRAQSALNLSFPRPIHQPYRMGFYDLTIEDHELHQLQIINPDSESVLPKLQSQQCRTFICNAKLVQSDSSGALPRSQKSPVTKSNGLVQGASLSRNGGRQSDTSRGSTFEDSASYKRTGDVGVNMPKKRRRQSPELHPSKTEDAQGQVLTIFHSPKKKLLLNSLRFKKENESTSLS